MTTQLQAPSCESLNIGIISYIGRLSLTSTNVRSVDLIYLREYLLHVLHAKNVDFISRKGYKEKDVPYYKNLLDTDLNEYDALYVYNGNYNIIGGKFLYETIPLMHKLTTYRGQLYYVLLDPKFPNIDPGINIKARVKNGMLKTDKGIFSIDENDLTYFSTHLFDKAIVAFAGHDYAQYVKLYNEKLAETNSLKQLGKDTSWYCLDLFGYYAVNEMLDKKLKTYSFESKKYDCVYYGNNRMNSRNSIVKKFYNTEKLNTLIIGYDPGYVANTSIKYVPHHMLFETIGSQCLSTLVVGDDLHNNNIITPRFYESMLLDVVAFIYIEFDKYKQYVKDEFLKDFIYVSTPEELYKKIEMIKSDSSLYRKIVEKERQEVLQKCKKYIRA